MGAKTGANKSGEGIAPPLLGPAVRFPYGAFQMKARITKGAEFEIQASSDLKNWHTIVTDTALEETIEYVDSEASKFSHRFYRMTAGPVNSANIIGYATITLPPGFSMVANPFDAPSNTVGALFKELPDGTKVNKYDTRNFQLNENILRDGKWTSPSEKLIPGEGALLFNPTSDYKPLSFVGDVIQGSLSLPIPGGFSMRSSLLPQAGRLHTDLAFPISEGDVIHMFDRDKQEYVLYPYEVEKWAANPPVLSVAESFWVAKTSPGNWNQNNLLSA